MSKRTYTEFGPPYVVVNLSKIGVRYFRILIKAEKETIEKMTPLMMDHPNAVWIFATSGWFNLGIGFWAKDNLEIEEVSSSIRQLLGSKDKIVAQSELTSLIGFGARPIDKQKKPLHILDGTYSEVDLSSVEIDVLKLLTLDADYSVEKISRIINISKKKTSQVIQQLKDRGVIIGKQKRINYLGKYMKVFVDSNSGKRKNSSFMLEEKLWKDEKCIYIERANDKYDVEFELVLQKKSDIQKYVKDFSEYKIIEMKENLSTNLFPVNKTLNVLSATSALSKKKGVYDLTDSKLWYLNHKSANSYVGIYQDKKYFEQMNQPEISLFADVAKKCKELTQDKTYHVVDLGSGNGYKGRYFCDTFEEKQVKAYYPVDISPIELAVAAKANEGAVYEVKPTVVDFENLDKKFPFTSLPEEGQIYGFFGGTYGNYEPKKINKYLKPLLTSKKSILLITMPIFKEKLSVSKVVASYSNAFVEDISFGPLKVIGFKKSDFKKNTKTNLYMHVAFEDRKIFTYYTLAKKRIIGGKRYNVGDVFKMTTSWKPTLNDFKKALKGMPVKEIVHNKGMAIAILKR